MIYSKFMQVKANKAPGADGFVQKLQKEVAKKICEPLCIIFIKSLQEDIVP